MSVCKTVASLRLGQVTTVHKSEITALSDLPDFGIEVAIIDFQDALRGGDARLVERLNDIRLSDKIAVVENVARGDDLNRFYQTFDPCFIQQGGRAILVAE